MVKTFATAIAAAALTVCLGTSASASPTDHLTKFTFNQPIALPGVTLAAGTYTFKLADPSIDRKIVQILDADGTRSFAMLQAIPTYREKESRPPELTLMDTASGMPAAVEAWWPLGERAGFEFVYPEEQYLKLTGNFSNDVIKGDGLTAAVAEGRVQNAVFTQASTARVRPQVEQTSASVATSVDPAASEERPGTGSSAALVAVLGALTLLGGVLALGKVRV
jgi:hypothetical protein